MWITCVLLWCFYQLFGLSFWRHPFTAEDPLVKNWYNATFLQNCSHEEKNSSPSWMAWGWAHFQQIFIFGWTIPLRNDHFGDAIISPHWQYTVCNINTVYFSTFSWQTEALTLLSDSYRYLCTMFMLLFLTVCSCSSVTPHCRFGPSLMLILHFYLQDLNSMYFSHMTIAREFCIVLDVVQGTSNSVQSYFSVIDILL